MLKNELKCATQEHKYEMNIWFSILQIAKQFEKNVLNKWEIVLWFVLQF